jgi:LuxR family transcriptional regulator, maltose regulon positive regulatory protein
LLDALSGKLPMAELSAAAPAEGAASERDVLLAIKLHVPRPGPGFVPRPRLVEALDDGLARRLILACAPAGFGKTVLLADWARRGNRSVAWLSLDAGDNDPARFWRHAVAALDRMRPGMAERAGPLLGPPAPPSFEGLVTALINELAARPGDGELLLVLDDYHLIDTRQVHESLVFLLEHLPPGVHLVLASRSDPPLPLARLRAGGQLAELRAGDLRFTAEEAAALLREAVDGDLPGAAVAALAARTEGWAAGLQLAALSLRGQPDVTAFVAAFSGSHRYVLDYLAGEVLEGQTDQVREFLLETSVLERLSGRLCDAVTGRTDSQAMLEQVERANLFLLPLDEVRGWWRYHHLFADLLRARLQQQQPGRVAALHHNAAAWCEEHGLADDAVRHALAAGDTPWAARLIERHFDETFWPGERATVQRWLSALPAELAGSRPRLCLVRAILALAGSDAEGAGPPLDAAERLSADATDEPFEPSAGKAASLLVNVPAAIALGRASRAHLRGDADGTAALASQTLAKTGEGESMLDSTARWLLAMAQWLRGQVAEAERAFAASITGWRAASERYSAAYGCHHLGRVQRARGCLDAAVGTYQQALEITTAPGRPAMPAAGIALIGTGEVAYQRNELEAALRQVTEGIERCRQLTYTQPLATGLAALAWIRQANGDPGGAREAIADAERVAPGPDVTSLLNPVPAERARLLLAQGEVAAAARWVEERGLAPDDEPGYPREPEYLVLARVLLAQDRPGPALALLGRLHAAATAQGRTASVIEIQALRALALAADDEEAAAVDALAQALMLGSPQGYVRVFADEGAPMAASVAYLVAAQRADQAARDIPLGYLAQLFRAFGQEPAAPGTRRASAAAVPGLAEQLTARELEILALLAAGTPNPRIAEQLVVTLDTVKKHVSHVLGKLGAANRTEAVTRARQLGLIP